MTMKLLLIDGNSIINRAFYGIRMLNAPDGTPTNGVYGFLTILHKLLEDEQPDGLCVAFDLKAPTFRHLQYDSYKAQRKAMPEELAVQMPLLKQTLDAMGVPRCELEGWEADDLLGSLARRCEEAGWDCRIVTGDKDSFQLISDRCWVKHIKSRMGKTESIDYDPARFREEYGLEPIRMIDLKALMGDASDNIPGVSGIGEKTALDLLHRFGSLEGIYENLNAPEIKPGARKKLEAGKEQAELSFSLATIRCDAPLPLTLEQCLCTPDHGAALHQQFTRLGFLKLIEKWGVTPAPDSPAAAAAPALPTREDAPLEELLAAIQAADTLAVYAPESLDMLEFCDGKTCYRADRLQLGFAYDGLLAALFAPEKKKYGHHVKELLALLLEATLPAEGFVFDTALAAYLLRATDHDYSLPRLCSLYGAAGDGAAAVWALTPLLREKLTALDMMPLFAEIELPLCRVLADMERCGFLVDRLALHDFGESLSADIAALQQKIWDAAGEEFNINSPKQLGHILFDKLQLPAGKKTKTGWSTNADVLEKLRPHHPIIQDVLDYRTLAKLKSTYADGLLKVIAPDGRIHTSFQMTVTATGRLSSTEPNLQNIPIRRELGSRIRKMFVAAPGKVLVDADYSQIELRLLAHISGDETMQKAFRDGADIHRTTAAQVFGVPPEEVTPRMRSQAKAVNFGIVYGISAFSLAQDIGVFQNQAKAYIDAYLANYHGVREYMQHIVAQAREQGFVETLWHRRRELPELKSRNFSQRSFGERVALNMPIQGTAADIIKLAMVRVHQRLQQEGLQARLLLQVHDELIVECPEAEAEQVKALLTQEMEQVAQLSVPLIAEAHSGKSWAEAK